MGRHFELVYRGCSWTGQEDLGQDLHPLGRNKNHACNEKSSQAKDINRRRLEY